MFLLPLIIFLPILEIIGFIVIGGRLGILWSFLWLVADVVVGSMLLRSINERPRRTARNPENMEEAALEDMFDGFCIFAGAMLLIFPGFVSDFFAAPLLIPPVRHLLFLYLRHKHGGVIDNINTTSQSFTYWYSADSESGARTGTHHESAASQTIEGEYRNVGDDKKLQ